MNLGETQQMHGVLTIEVIDAAGHVVETRRVPNLITMAGKELLANLLMGKAAAVPNVLAIAVGSGTSDPTPQAKKLHDEKARAVAKTNVKPATKDSKEVILATVEAVLPQVALDRPQALTEAGIIVTVGTSETLFNRVKFAEVNRGSNMVLNLAWEIIF